MENRWKREFCRQNYTTLLYYFLAAVVMNLFIELLARRSVDDLLRFVFGSPHLFLYGVLIIFTMLSVSLLLRRRNFWFMVVCALWVGLALTDFILLSFRSMPLTASDIWLMSSVRGIFEKYLTHFQLLLIMIGIAVLLGIVIFIWVRSKKQKPIPVFAALHFGGLCLLLAGATALLFGAGLIDKPEKFSSLPKAYHDNGFAYSFAVSMVTRGVKQPEKYSPDEVEAIIDVQEELPSTSEKTPNIIFVQLESFFDPNYLKDLTFEENPVPNFQYLKAHYPSGFLSVPAIGAGTANTEFEMLTGMNLRHFGVGEYPYMTIVNSLALESMGTALSEIGYATHAIHNNNATFYDRDIVYNNLGFQTFTSLEYMNNVEYNPLGWAKDSVLIEEIHKAVESTEEEDFVFAVSVQPHGKYPTTPIDGAPTIAVEGMTDPGKQAGMEYYLGQLKECDRFIGDLVESFRGYQEPVVIVFYGDHLPSFNIQQEALSDGTTQTTEYVIWANFTVQNIDQNLQAYQLGAYVMNFCNIHEGPIFRIHQSYRYGSDDDPDYQEALKVMEYDMISGEYYAGKPAWMEEPFWHLRFDVEDVEVTSVIPARQSEAGTYLITGNHFTPFSRVYINDVAYETEYIASKILRITGFTPEEENQVTVAQISGADETDILSQSQPFLYRVTGEQSPMNETISTEARIQNARIKQKNPTVH